MLIIEIIYILDTLINEVIIIIKENINRGPMVITEAYSVTAVDVLGDLIIHNLNNQKII
ncbi:MAG: hypothetical protein HeimC2_43670 [Candidatus Heimdallarchaeota archaeon LC_2]|nr:MAG: hypothetical protein HeimC2_43670 [Candidatus Heimdallarchaeota archaeon LC_2]